MIRVFMLSPVSFSALYADYSIIRSICKYFSPRDLRLHESPIYRTGAAVFFSQIKKEAEGIGDARIFHGKRLLRKGQRTVRPVRQRARLHRIHGGLSAAGFSSTRGHIKLPLFPREERENENLRFYNKCWGRHPARMIYTQHFS